MEETKFAHMCRFLSSWISEHTAQKTLARKVRFLFTVMSIRINERKFIFLNEI